MRIDGVTYGKLKTPLKVNGNLNYKTFQFVTELKEFEGKTSNMHM